MNYNLKLFIKVFLKCLFILLLFYGAIEVTKEYFSYPYVYTLFVKPSTRLDLPPITVCTERGVIFVKTKIFNYLNLSREYEEYKQNVSFKSKQYLNDCLDSKKSKDGYRYGTWACDEEMKNFNNYYMNTFYEKFELVLLSNFTFRQLYDNFTVKSSELIHCSAKLHSKDKTNNNSNNSSDSQVITDCSQSYAVLETIYGNKDFGICFTYFYTNHNNYYLIDDDFIKFDINYETQQNIFKNEHVDLKFKRMFDFSDSKTKIFEPSYFKKYFVFYIFTNNNINSHFLTSKDTALKTVRIGTHIKLRLSKTYVDLLSAPFMDYCTHQGL